MGGLLYRLDLLVLLGSDRMADVVAITAYAQFWFPGLSDWVASLAVILLLLGLNATVKMFGEMEFWFAMIKIVAIVALIVVGGNGDDAFQIADRGRSLFRPPVE